MGFPDHPSDQDRQDAPNMHVEPDQPTTDYQQPDPGGSPDSGSSPDSPGLAGGYQQTPGYPEQQGYPGQQAGGYQQTPGYPGYSGYPGPGQQAGGYQPGGYQPGGYQPGGYQPGGYQPGYPIAGPVGRVNSMSVAALICGLAQFLLWFLLLVPGFIAAVLALIFGAVALGQIQRRHESGRGLALTGIVLGGLGVLGGVALGILIGVGSAHYHAHMGY